MSGNAVGRRYPERKLAPFQATRQAHVYRTSQFQNRVVERKGSTTRGLTSLTMTASLYYRSFESQVRKGNPAFGNFKFHRRVQD